MLLTNQLNLVDFSNQSEESLAQIVLENLDTKGYVVISNYRKDVIDIDQLSNHYMEISSQIGTPISHDVNNKMIWDIKSNPKSNSLIKTYSEHNHEAELHTDSQYSEYPEDYFGLLTLTPAVCGGGISYLLSLEDILSELRALPAGQQIEHTLRTHHYPFIVPNVFKKSASDEVEYNFGPILRDNEIRFRIDTFEKAIDKNPEFCNQEQLDAYKTLKQVILNTSATKRFFLKSRDLIFINNKTMLHGRSPFTDSNRHLLRIRMNKMG